MGGLVWNNREDSQRPSTSNSSRCASSSLRVSSSTRARLEAKRSRETIAASRIHMSVLRIRTARCEETGETAALDLQQDVIERLKRASEARLADR